MNLAPRWVQVFEDAGIQAVHWTEIGPGDAPDSHIMRHAREHGYCVFMHDLDFGATLAASGAAGLRIDHCRGRGPGLRNCLPVCSDGRGLGVRRPPVGPTPVPVKHAVFRATGAA